MYGERPVTFEDTIDWLKFVTEGEGQLSEQHEQNAKEILFIIKKYDKIKFTIDAYLTDNYASESKAFEKIIDIICEEDEEEAIV
jgi:hypothetical protein